MLVSCGDDSTVRLWDAAGGRQLKQITAGDQALYSLAFHPDGRRVAVGGLDKQIRILDVVSGSEQVVENGHSDFIHRVVFNAKGNRLLSCGYGRSLAVRSFPDGKLLLNQQLPAVANFVNYSPDETQVVAASGDGMAYLIDLPPAAR